MDAQTKRTMAATALCLLLLFGWIKIQQIYNPPPPIKPAPTSAATGEPVASALSQDSPAAASSAPATGTTPVTPSASGVLEYVLEGGTSTEPIVLGDDRQDNKREQFVNPYRFGVVISPVGASVEEVRLSEHRSHVARNRKNPDHAPYVLLQPVKDLFTGDVYRSFVTESIRLVEEKKDISLGSAVWTAVKSRDEKGETATLTTVVKLGSQPVLRLTKTFRVEKESPLVTVTHEIENLGPKAASVRLTQTGPTGLMREDQRYDMVRAMFAVVDADGRPRKGVIVTRDEVYGLAEHRRDFVPTEGSQFLWTSVSNKYYTCIVAPRPSAGSESRRAGYLDQLYAVTRVAEPKYDRDLTVKQVFAPKDAIAPGGKVTFVADTYCGPKSDRAFDPLPLAKSLNFGLTMSPDRSMCTFDVLNVAMLWLLTHIHDLIGNYGIAIILLVIIVRAILHPISKRGQINMMRMQKNMARIKPKLDVIQEQYKNDKQKLSEETMKLYREEGVNPAASMMGCLPMFLQMPIWVALYTTLNTTVDLRHAPFFGYIRDLSAPDALISFGGEYHIPLISTLMGGAITSFNLLPIIMTLLMYGQQKLTQKLTKPDKPPPPKLDKDGRPLPDTMAQQQKMMNFMMIFMGFIFYNMPSGLCLYILCSSLFGMIEQWYIRKHIKEKEVRGEFEPAVTPAGAAPKPGGGWLARKIAEMQKLAEQQRLAQAKGQATNGKRKKSRF